MVYPSGTPVQEQILDNVKTTLEGIAPPNYLTGTTGVAMPVSRLRGENVFEIAQRPGILISIPDVKSDDQTSAIVSHVMEFTVRAFVEDRVDAQQSAVAFAQDVTRALTIDWTRGGAAMTTRVLGHTTFQTDLISPICGADLFVQILFRHLYDDPNTPI